jgi:hypothetical protein
VPGLQARCAGDGTNACPSCLRKGIECIYLPPRKRGPKSGQLRNLMAEVETLRGVLQQPGALGPGALGLQQQQAGGGGGSGTGSPGLGTMMGTGGVKAPR